MWIITFIMWAIVLGISAITFAIRQSGGGTTPPPLPGTAGATAHARGLRGLTSGWTPMRWVLVMISLICLIYAVFGVGEMGEILKELFGLRLTHLALFLSACSAGLAIWWINTAGNPMPTHLRWAWTMAILATMLLIIGLWGDYIQPVLQYVIDWSAGAQLPTTLDPQDLGPEEREMLAHQAFMNKGWLVVVGLIVLCFIKATRPLALVVLAALVVIFLVTMAYMHMLRTTTTVVAEQSAKTPKVVHSRSYQISSDQYTPIDWPDDPWDIRDFARDSTGTRPSRVNVWVQQEGPEPESKPLFVIEPWERLTIPCGDGRIWVSADTPQGEGWELLVLYWNK